MAAIFLRTERADHELIWVDAEREQLIADKTGAAQRESNIAGARACPICVPVDHDQTIEVLFGPRRDSTELTARRIRQA